MGYMIVSGNKPSPVSLHTKSCNSIYRNALIKCQIFVLILNIPKKPSGMVLKSPQLTISLTLIAEIFEYAL